jgi:alpha-glucuronidase
MRSLFLCVLLLAPIASHAQEFGVYYSSEIPQLGFAVSEIHAALQAQGRQCIISDVAHLSQSIQSVRIVLLPSIAAAKSFTMIASGSLKEEESYLIATKRDRAHTTYSVVGYDPAGAMYGGLDIAEAIRLGTLD